MSEHDKVVRKHGWVKGKPSNEGNTTFEHPDLRHHKILVFGKGHWQHDKVFPNDNPAVAMTMKTGNNPKDLGKYLAGFHKKLNVTEGNILKRLFSKKDKNPHLLPRKKPGLLSRVPKGKEMLPRKKDALYDEETPIFMQARNSTKYDARYFLKHPEELLHNEDNKNDKFKNRLNKILSTKPNTRPEKAPETLGSPSDRGPTLVPKIKKGIREETPAGNCMGASSDTSGPIQTYSPLLGGGVPPKTKKKKKLVDILLKRKTP